MTIELEFGTGQFAAIDLDRDLTVSNLRYEGFDDTAQLRPLITPFAVVEGRSRLGSTDLLNVNAFPLTIPANCEDSGSSQMKPDEDVTLQLAEGRGVAASWSSRLNALTVWWVGHADELARTASATFRGEAARYVAPVSPMRSFRSATSSEYADAVIFFVAIPQKELQNIAKIDKHSAAISFAAHGLSGLISVCTTPIGRRSVSARFDYSRPHLEVLAAVRDLPWETLVRLSEPLQICVNNHPQIAPDLPESDPDEDEPTTNPSTSPDEDSLDTRRGHEYFGAAYRYDVLRFQIPRSGSTRQLLYLDGPDCVAGSSPTISSFTFYWLASRNEPTPEVRVTVSGRTVSACQSVQRFRASLSHDAEFLDVELRSIQLPYATFGEMVSLHGAAKLAAKS